MTLRIARAREAHHASKRGGAPRQAGCRRSVGGLPQVRDGLLRRRRTERERRQRYPRQRRTTPAPRSPPRTRSTKNFEGCKASCGKRSPAMRAAPALSPVLSSARSFTVRSAARSFASRKTRRSVRCSEGRSTSAAHRAPRTSTRTAPDPHGAWDSVRRRLRRGSRQG